MKLSHAICLASAVLVASPLLHAGEPDGKVVAFSASVRVDVDANGKPIQVEAPADLPDAIRTYIEKRVATWHYDVAKQNGVPAPATTFVGVNACAVPTQGGYRLGLDFNGNGARRAGDKRLNPPLYPGTAERGGTTATFILILGVDARGTATIDKVEKAIYQGRQGRNQFLPELARWVKTIRFDTEWVAGKPVETRVRIAVNFSLGGHGSREDIIADVQTKAKASRECQVAAGASEMKAVALDSVVKVTPLPHG